MMFNVFSTTFSLSVIMTLGILETCVNLQSAFEQSEVIVRGLFSSEIVYSQLSF